MNAESPKSSPEFSLFRSWFSMIGLVISLGSLFSFVLLLSIELMAGQDHSPYQGILTFVVAPMFLALGMVMIALGWLMQRRHVIKSATGTPPPFLSIDLSRPQDRRNLAVFLVGSLVFLLFSALGSYHTFHYSESVEFCGNLCHPPMKPEFTAYQHSPHARVSCTECHVGAGATSFVKAKLNGVHQLYATVLNKYSRPIKTPVKNMPVAQSTCEQCHWKAKYVGNLDRTYNRFLSDDENTAVQIRMMLKVGGGDPTHGPVGGIHWHMNITNKVEYIATDEKRQVIPWVRFTSTNGVETVYRTEKFVGDPAKYTIRTMDCMDCHNRPAHQLRSPNDAVDVAMSLGRINPKLKAIKKNAVAALAQNYAGAAEAKQKIEATLRTAYAKEAGLEATIAEVQKIYADNFFPDMKANWKAYPDNLGHKDWPGCFRCHDGNHKTADKARKIEASNCGDCHTLVAQSKGAEIGVLESKGVKFTHPDASSEGTDPDCTTCHSGGP